MNTSIPLTLVAAFAIACADGTLPPRTADDPSNPRAPETPLLADPASPPRAPVIAGAGGTRNPHEHQHHAMPSPSSGPP